METMEEPPQAQVTMDTTMEPVSMEPSTVDESVVVESLDNEIVKIEAVKTRGRAVLRKMHVMQQQNIFCDAEIICQDGTSFFGHSCVFSACSISLNNSLMNNEFRINVDLPSRGLSYIVSYMYSSRLEIVKSQEEELLKEIHKCASLLEMKDLVRLITRHVDGPEADVYKPKRKNPRKSSKPKKHAVSDDVTGDVVGADVSVDNSTLHDDEDEFMASGGFEGGDLKPDTEENSDPDKPKREVQDHECPICHKKFRGTERSLQQHLRVHKELTIFKCPAEGCSYTSTKIIRYKPHVAEHPGVKAFHCTEEGCTYSTSSDWAFKNHKMGHTPEGLPHKCDQCEHAFLKRSDLEKHLRWHSGERPHVCSICDKRFMTPYALKLHVQTHTGAKPHVCSQCGVAYREVYALRDHIKSQHEGKLFECTQCGKGFPSRSALSSHKSKIHRKGFRMMKVCTTCGAQFSQTGHLKVHEMFHRVEKPHTCSVCNKGFTQKTDLRRHELIHTGVKPYLCSVCPFSTIRKAYLTKHEKSHRGTDGEEKPIPKPRQRNNLHAANGLARAASQVPQPQNTVQIKMQIDEEQDKPTFAVDEYIDNMLQVQQVGQQVQQQSHQRESDVQRSLANVTVPPFTTMAHLPPETNMLLLNPDVPLPSNNVAYPVHHTSYAHLPTQDTVHYVVVPQQPHQDHRGHTQYQ